MWGVEALVRNLVTARCRRRHECRRVGRRPPQSCVDLAGPKGPLVATRRCLSEATGTAISRRSWCSSPGTARGSSTPDHRRQKRAGDGALKRSEGRLLWSLRSSSDRRAQVECTVQAESWVWRHEFWAPLSLAPERSRRPSSMNVGLVPPGPPHPAGEFTDVGKRHVSPAAILSVDSRSL